MSDLSDDPSPVLTLRLLGRMRATDRDGNSVLPRGRKARAMLAVLALTGTPMLRDTLMQMLWSQRDQEQARASFRQTLHELQSALTPAGDVLPTTRGVVALQPSGIWCDALAILRGAPEALGLIGGGVLGEDLSGLDPALDRWLERQRDRIERACVQLAEAALDDQPDPQSSAAAAERLLALQPTHEAGCRTLMRAMLDLGRPSDALAAYDRCAAALSDRAGLAPSAETKALREQVLTPAVAIPAILPVPAPQPRGSGVRLGVMPFRSLDDGGASLSIGLAEEITTALARFRWMFLIASPSVAAIAHEPRSGSARWEALNLDFLLDGTVQRGLGRVRVNARLLDLRAGEELVWSRRFDRDGDDLLALQDEIAAETVAQVDPELLLREGQRSRRQQPSSITAYDLLLRAIPALYRIEEAPFLEAGLALRQAVELDPSYGAAQAWWAFWHVFLVGQGWAADPVAAMTRAGTLAERAVALDPADARALTIAGHVQAFLHHRIPEARVLHERALSLNPNLPLAWGFAGLAQSYAGEHEDAIRMIGQALRLSPFDPHGFFFQTALMMPLLLTGQHELVVQQARRATALNPFLSSTYKGLLSALGHLGREEEARTIRLRLLALEPGFDCEQAAARSPLLRAADIATYVEGLRLGGLR
jgi:DNA-binding SARP family transcriptional activator/TolB-like protein